MAPKWFASFIFLEIIMIVVVMMILICVGFEVFYNGSYESDSGLR
jgi:hypothetical protein